MVRLVRKPSNWTKKEPDDNWPKQKDLWKTKDGRSVQICAMSDEHLVNTLRMLKRGAIKVAAEKKRVTGKKVHWRKIIKPIFEKMDIEAERRGIVWENTNVLD